MSRRTDTRPGRAAPPLPVAARARLLPLAAVLALLLAGAPDARAQTVPGTCDRSQTLDVFESVTSTADSISVTFKDPMPSGYSDALTHAFVICYQKADSTWSTQQQATEATKPVAGTTHTFNDIRDIGGTKVADFAAETDYYVAFGNLYGNTSREYHIRTKAAGGNNAPTVANQIPNQTATADTGFSYTFPANTFSDADSGDTLTYTATKSDDGALPTWLTFTDSTRTFSGTPATTDVGTVSVKVTASDGTASVSDTFDIVVSSTDNSAPTVANEIPDQAATAGTAFSYTFPANTFADADSGDTLSYTATKSDGTALPAWLTFEPTGPGTGDPVVKARTFEGTPAAADIGTLSVKVTASDGTASVSDTFDIVVGAGVPGPGKLVGNTGQSRDSWRPAANSFAMAFGTGRSTLGYVLTRVDVKTNNLPTATRDALTATIRPASSTVGIPGDAILGTLEIGTYHSTSQLTTFAAPGAGIDLDRNTTYYLNMGTSPGAGGNWGETTSDDEDSGADPGWWVSNSEGGRTSVPMIAVHGYGKGSAAAPPHVVTSSVVDKALALNFSWDLHPDWVPKPSQFTVKVAGRAVAVADVALSGKTVALTLAEAAGAGQAVTVSYTMAGVPIRTSVGDALSFTDKPITNNSTNNAPVGPTSPTADRVAAPGAIASFALADNAFSDPDGDALTYSFSVDPDSVVATSETWTGENPPPGLNWAQGRVYWRMKTSCQLRNVEPALPEPFRTVLTVTATDPTGAAAHYDLPLSTTAGTPCPELQTASVADRTLTLTYDGSASITVAGLSASEFAVTVDGRAATLSDTVAINRTTAGGRATTVVTLTLADTEPPVGLGQTVTASHTPPAPRAAVPPETDDVTPTTVGFTDEEVTVTSTNSAPTVHCGVDKDDNPEPCEPNDLSKNAPPGTLSNTPLGFGDVDTDTIAACDSDDPAYDESLVCSGDRKLTFTWVTGRPEVFDSAHSGYVVHFIPRFTGLYLKVLSACALRELDPPPPALFETTTTVTATDATGAVRRVTVVTQTRWSPDDCPELALVLSGAGGGALRLVYDRALDEDSVPPASLFTVKADGTAVDLAASDAVAVEGNAVVLTLAAAVTAGQSVTVSYAPPQTGVGGIESADSHAAGAFEDVAATVDVTRPALLGTGGATVQGQTLTLSYNEVLDPVCTAVPSQYQVVVTTSKLDQEGNPVFYVGVVTDLVVDARRVVLTLERAVAGTDTVTLVYGLRQQTTEPKPPCNVRDLAGNEALSIVQPLTVAHGPPPDTEQSPGGGGGGGNQGGVGGGGRGGGGGVGGGSQDDHGNSASQATRLAFGAATPRWAAIRGQINDPRDVDYFRLSVPQAGVLVFETTGRTDTRGTVWQGDTVLATATRGGAGQNFRLSSRVTAGEVVVAVASNGRQTGNYVLQTALVVGYLGNPGAHSFQSGIGIISGWVCDAAGVQIEILPTDGAPIDLEAAYGTERPDTDTLPDGTVVCGDTDNGFGLLVNWNEFGAGEHTVVARVDGVPIGRRSTVDGVELGRATVTVTPLDDDEPFVRGLAGACTVDDFPGPDERVTLEWQQAQQNFVIAGGDAPAGANRAGEAGVGFLGNPGANSFQSGIGVISGWVCEAEAVEIEILPADGEPVRLAAAYGTERPDTAYTEDGVVVCGDTDNGFGLLVNWNEFGAGEHAVVAWVDGAELGRATVTVTLVEDDEPFVRGLVGTCEVADFPGPDETTTLEWQQGVQNFVITGVD